MSDPKTSNPSQPDGGPTKSHSPVVRIIEWVVIGALGLVVANEAYSKFSYDATLAELEKAIDAAQTTGDDLASDEVAPLISGMPSRKEVVDGRKTLVDYQWQSLFKTYRIVVHTAPSPENEMVVLRFETDAPPEEPQPAAVAGDGNSEPPSDPIMPGGGGSGGPPGMHGGRPGPMGGGAGRPELESDGDDQPEESNDEADDTDNEPAESEEVSEETDETTDETVETEEAPEESGETTDEATEETDPSA